VHGTHRFKRVSTDLARVIADHRDQGGPYIGAENPAAPRFSRECATGGDAHPGEVSQQWLERSIANGANHRGHGQPAVERHSLRVDSYRVGRTSGLWQPQRERFDRCVHIDGLRLWFVSHRPMGRRCDG
jgi:hypothetical protein